jgi:lysophospholipase L1-like esterase
MPYPVAAARGKNFGSVADPYRVNLVSGLVNYKAALGTYGKATILVTGDSVGVGQGASPTTLGWVWLLKAALETKYGGNAGRYYACFDATEKALWTLGTGWNYAYASGTGYHFQGDYNYMSGGGALAVTLPGIAFDFYCIRNSSMAGHQVQIDSETPFTMGEHAWNWTEEKVTQDGFSSGDHTIVWTSPSGPAFLGGVMAHLSDTGIILDNLSISGITVSGYLSQTWKLAHRRAAGWDLTIIPLTINDYTNQTALATYKTQLEATVDAAQNGGGDALLVACNPVGTSLTIPYASYAAKMKEVAEAKVCAFIDMSALYGNFAAWSAAGWMYDNYHPSTTGHAVYFDEIKQWL